MKATDGRPDADLIIRKILNTRIFHDQEAGKSWSKNVAEIEGEILCISQFTLYGRVRGRSPDFSRSMKSEEAKSMYDDFLQELGNAYDSTRIKDGVFGEMMDVSLCNDGPVTFVVDSDGTVGITT
jgi:D-aminoacyl-tRNA deacylase